MPADGGPLAVFATPSIDVVIEPVLIGADNAHRPGVPWPVAAAACTTHITGNGDARVRKNRGSLRAALWPLGQPIRENNPGGRYFPHCCSFLLRSIAGFFSFLV